MSFETMYAFGANPKNPQAALTQGNDGNFYGTTAFGGSAGENGTVIRMTSNGVLTVLHSFNGSSGSRPMGKLLLASDGHFYGTTAFGGPNDHGTIFRIGTNGQFVSMLAFSGTNGSRPMAALIQGSDGSFYGTTQLGGADADNGTVFRITAGGQFASLFSFPGDGRNGSGPVAGLVQANDGNLYGTTEFGGSSGDNGTVFRITPSGQLTTLFSFSGRNGSGPVGALARGADGKLYGTTQFGGVHDDGGTIFKLTTNGALTSLCSFRGSDGIYPTAGLVLGSDGNFYGTSSGDGSFGGTNSFGTVFRVTPEGRLRTMVSFDGVNGACPFSALLQGKDGKFYGTTFEGGPGGGGTIFRLVVPAVIPSIAEFKGTYNGLFYQTNEINLQSCGFLTLTLGNAGVYSARLLINGKTHVVSGQFDVTEGTATNFILRSTDSGLAVSMTLKQTGDTCQIHGQLTALPRPGGQSIENWTSVLTANRAAFHATFNPTPLAGSYTALIPASTGPAGHGFGTVRVSPGGRIVFSGMLADGTRAVQTAILSKDGLWPFYVAVRQGGNALVSWIRFDSGQPDTDLRGLSSWIKESRPTSKYYPGGFTNETVIVGSFYSKPSVTNAVLDLTTARVCFGGGNLTSGFTNAVTMDSRSIIINLGDNPLRLSIVRGTGLIRGSVTTPDGSRAFPFAGAVLQKQNRGAGCFLGNDQSGEFTFGR